MESSSRAKAKNAVLHHSGRMVGNSSLTITEGLLVIRELSDLVRGTLLLERLRYYEALVSASRLSSPWLFALVNTPIGV